MIFSRGIVLYLKSLQYCVDFLLENLRYDSSTNSPSTFSDREAETLVHGDRRDQLDLHLHVVARHHHLHPFRQLDTSSHVGRSEVELRPVTLEERRVSPTLFLGQHVNLGRELRVRRDRAGLGQNHPTLHVLLVDTAEKEADVVTSLAVVQELPEHLDASDDGLLVRVEADEGHFLADLDLALLDSARRYGTTTGDREHVFNRHQEGLLGLTLGLRDIGIKRIHELADLLAVLAVGVA